MRTVTAVKTLLVTNITLICIPLNFIAYILLHETRQMWVSSSEGEFVKDHMIIKFRKRYVHTYLLILK